MVHEHSSAGRRPTPAQPRLAVAVESGPMTGESDARGAGEKVEWRFPPRPEVPSMMRAKLRPVLTAWGIMGERAEDALLVATELVANAIDHARTSLRMQVRIGGPVADGVLLIGVHDRRADLAPRPTAAGPHELRGRGLRVIDALAQRWGCDPAPDGKTVWAELSLQG